MTSRYPDFIEHLRCPETGNRLMHRFFGKEDDMGWPDGVLFTEQGHWYPVIKGIPRLLSGQMRGDYSHFWRHYSAKLASIGLKSDDTADNIASKGQGRQSANEQTCQSFGAKWNSQPQWGFKGGSAKMINTWLLNKYGWKSPEAYQEMVAAKRRILDAGTGLGREVIRCAQANDKALIFGMDLSDSVLSAAQNISDYPNTVIIQADILNPPFEPESFDLILAEGVLHHTPDTRNAFLALVKLLEPGGEISFYVYLQKGPVREFCDDFLRNKISALEPDKAFEEAKCFTRLGKALSAVTQEIEVPDIPLLDIPAGHYKLQRLFYWHFLKCFWNDDLSFEENNLVNFDWYHPRYAHRHTPDEVRCWLAETELVPVWMNVERSGITVRAIKQG